MATVTYADPEVQRYIQDHFVPVQINVVDHPEAADELNAAWTPTIVIESPDAGEHRRIEGFLDPPRFLAELALGVFRAALDEKDFATAKNRVNEALQRSRGDPQREPEALYWTAVTEYKLSHDANQLLSGWRRMLDQYPDSDWAKRAEFIQKK